MYGLFSPETLGKNSIEILRERSSRFAQKNVEQILPQELTLKSQDLERKKVQPPCFFIGWFPNHHYFNKGWSSSKRNHPFFDHFGDFQGRERKYNQKLAGETSPKKFLFRTHRTTIFSEGKNWEHAVLFFWKDCLKIYVAKFRTLFFPALGRAVFVNSWEEWPWIPAPAAGYVRSPAALKIRRRCGVVEQWKERPSWLFRVYIEDGGYTKPLLILSMFVIFTYTCIIKINQMIHRS